MANKTKFTDLEFFSTLILSYFFGVHYDADEEKGKRFLGDWVKEHGGTEQVWKDYFEGRQADENQKQEIIAYLNECANSKQY